MKEVDVSQLVLQVSDLHAQVVLYARPPSWWMVPVVGNIWQLLRADVNFAAVCHARYLAVVNLQCCAMVERAMHICLEVLFKAGLLFFV